MSIKINRFYLFLGLSLLISLFWSWIITLSYANQYPEIKISSWIYYDSLISMLQTRDNNATPFEAIFQNYLSEKEKNSDRWLTFTSILSTLFAVFFVYTWFKIEWTKNKVDEAEKRILENEKRFNEDIFEFAHQLQYAICYMLEKQYEKAIDAFTVLKSEPFVLKSSKKLNTCYYFLAHCYYERWVLENDKWDIAIATEYIDLAIDNPLHPFKREIVEKFNEMNTIQEVIV